MSTPTTRPGQGSEADHDGLLDALRSSEERRRRQASELTAVLNATHAQLALLDSELRFVMVNDAYERACGHARQELLGRPHFALFPHEENERIFRRVLESGEPFLVSEKPFEYALQPERGVSYWDWSLVPVRSDAGQVQGVLLSLLDVTEHVRARRASEALAAALRESDRRKTEFLGLLSHELRNPLAPILNAIHVLQRADASGEQSSRAKVVIQRQVEHLTRLVDDLLDVTRIARGKIELRRARVDLAAIARRAAEDHRCVLEDRGVALSLELPECSVWVDGDATRLSQVLGNVLHNAAKFTDRAGRVTLSVSTGGDAAEIRVADTGAGIDPALLTRVFEPFLQATPTMARTEGGLGLGLALVKTIVELHGGSARAESAGLGHGTEIVIDLPLALSAPAEPPRPVAPTTGAARRVLVVDDNRDAAESLAELVEMFGHAVEVAFDGESAVAKARARPPEIVLCDIGLPGMSGYEVAMALRAEGQRGRLVAISGYAQAQDVKRAVEAGFDVHLAKPAPPAEIIRLLGE